MSANTLELANTIVTGTFKNKTDKGGNPYMSHLSRVAEKLKGNNIKAAALLHDILEDCKEWNEQALRNLFPDNIVDTVVALTKKENQSYDDYLLQVMSDDWASLIKLHDLEDNMNITRLKELSGKDCDRLMKYHKAWLKLKEHCKEKYLI